MRFKLGRQRLGHLRMASKFLRVFPRDESSTDVIARYMGSISVPEQLAGFFKLAYVIDTWYGFDEE